MNPGLFVWEKIGRSWVAHVRDLTLVVDERGNKKRGLRWRVRTVFGAQIWRCCAYEKVEDALLEAEGLAATVGLPAFRDLEKLFGKRRRAIRNNGLRKVTT